MSLDTNKSIDIKATNSAKFSAQHDAKFVLSRIKGQISLVTVFFLFLLFSCKCGICKNKTLRYFPALFSALETHRWRNRLPQLTTDCLFWLQMLGQPANFYTIINPYSLIFISSIFLQLYRLGWQLIFTTVFTPASRKICSISFIAFFHRNLHCTKPPYHTATAWFLF